MNFPNNKKNKKKENSSTGYNSETLPELTFSPGTATIDIELDKKNKNSRHFSMDVNLSEMNLSEKTEMDMEYDYGNVEYKLKLVNMTNDRIEKLCTQMKFRIQEGGGECFYEIGVEDNGNPLGLSEEELKISLETLHMIAYKLNATANVVKYLKGKVGYIAEIMIKLKEPAPLRLEKPEIRIGLIGDESSGKSTLIGVLISNKLDNGKGMARTNVFRHKHEILCGKSSSMSHQILGFDENGEVTNYGGTAWKVNSWSDIVHKSSKIINFYDMGGSGKAFKTAVKI
jgi:GTPase